MGGPHTQDDQTCMFGDRLPAFEERLIQVQAFYFC